MRLLFLVLGAFLLFVYFTKLSKASKYDVWLENLDSSEYPMKSFYAFGFALSEGKLFALKGKLRDTIITQAKLLHEEQYVEFYANVCWAQIISTIYVTLMIFILVAAAFNSVFFAFFGVVIAVVLGYYFSTRMSEILNKRRDNCASELPEIVSTMALLINSGMVLREAWRVIAEKKEGIVYTLMKQACDDMDNGYSDVDAIYKFGVLSSTPEIKKFTSSLIQGLEKGSKDLSNFLTEMSMEMWEEKKQMMLQKGEAAATKLLIPIAIIFVGIMVLVISGAIGLLV